MTKERELLAQAAERLAGHASNLPDRYLGDIIYKYLYSTQDDKNVPFIPLQAREQEE